MPIELDESCRDGAKIKVVGVGGCGGNAINNMIESGLTGVEFIVANTDKQALDHNKAEIKLQVGAQLTKGLGAGGRPIIGKEAVEESIDIVREALKGSDMVFVTAGMGGGSGTGGAPLIAKIAKETDALVVGIVTKPFNWEGKVRNNAAEDGIKELRDNVDALIVIPNQRILEIIDKNVGFSQAFKTIDEILYNATKGISEIIGRHGIVNVDFADVVSIMKGMGDAIMGIGTASGDDRAQKATRLALNSPMLDGISIKGAQGVLVNITGGKNLGMFEIAEVVQLVEEESGGNANIIHGVVENDSDQDEISVTIVATGFKKESKPSLKGVQEELPLTKEASKSRTPLITPRDPSNIDRTFPINNPMSHVNDTYQGPTRVSASHNKYQEITRSPRGISELVEYNIPAFERKGIVLPNFNKQD